MTIRGGSDGAAMSGNMRSGFSMSFLPARCSIVPEDIITRYNRGDELPVEFIVRVQNTLGAWIEIPDCGYVQINKNPEGDTESTSITIQDSETWSAYGTLHPGLLKPSNRIIQILAGVTGDSLSPIFSGRITNYQQPEGSNGGAINLTCRDIRAIFQRQTAVSASVEQTAFNSVKRQMHGTLRAAGLAFSAQFPDSAGLIAVVGSRLDAIDTNVPNKQWYNTSTGAIIVATRLVENIEAVGDLIELSDFNIFIATRSISDENAFNSVRVQGISGGVVVTETVDDDADVLDRGRIFYSGGIIGGPTQPIEQSREIAEAMIFANVSGRFDLEIPFNPYLELGQVIAVQSDRFNISPSLAVIQRVRHQYQVGNAVTYLDQLELLPGA
jgi:hypothetical protein